MIYVEVFAYYCDVIIVEQLVYYFILKEASPIYDITRYSSIKNVIFIPFLPGYVIRIKIFLIYPCLCKWVLIVHPQPLESRHILIYRRSETRKKTVFHWFSATSGDKTPGAFRSDDLTWHFYCSPYIHGLRGIWIISSVKYCKIWRTEQLWYYRYNILQKFCHWSASLFMFNLK